MRYKSTRNSQLRLEASQVIAQGISEEGGLFVPETLPNLREELPALAKLEYPALAKTIFRKFDRLHLGRGWPLRGQRLHG